MHMADQMRKPIFAECGECGECGEKWIAAWLPMALPLVIKLLKSLRCPRCASEECFVLEAAPRHEHHTEKEQGHDHRRDYPVRGSGDE